MENHRSNASFLGKMRQKNPFARLIWGKPGQNLNNLAKLGPNQYRAQTQGQICGITTNRKTPPRHKGESVAQPQIAITQVKHRL